LLPPRENDTSLIMISYAVCKMMSIINNRCYGVNQNKYRFFTS